MNPVVSTLPASAASFSLRALSVNCLGRLPIAGMVLGAIALATLPAARADLSTEYAFTTIAGVGAKSGSRDGTGGGANLPLFNRPTGLAVNPSGNIVVTDSGNSLIRLVTPGGAVTSIAGSPGRVGSTDGTGVDGDVRFNSPQGPAVDSAGNIYVADSNSSTIRKITPTGVVTTFAGTAGSSGSADGTGTAATFNLPSAVAIDGADNLYVADSGNHTIRKITSAGIVTTLAGTAGINGTVDGTGAAARFRNPRGIATDAAGNVYVADTGNNTIRKIASGGVVTTLAGTAGAFGFVDGTGTAARFNFPLGLAVDAAGNVFVADVLNNCIRRISSAGVVTTLAGSGAGAAGRADGTGTEARFSRPTDVAIDAAGNLYVSDDDNQQIRKVTTAGAVTTVAGVAGAKGVLDGTGYLNAPALFYEPMSTAVDASGNVYVADAANNAIRKITPAGVVTTLAGNSAAIGWADGVGDKASFTAPSGVATDAAGNVYVADTGSHVIRKVAPDGTTRTIAGKGDNPGAVDGTGAAARFNFPSGVAVDAAGNLYVADYGNQTIRKITPGGVVSTLAGTAKATGSADGTGAGARFNAPRAVAVDNAGNVYVADSGNQLIRKITSGGGVTTLAGSPGVTGSANGTGGAARFDNPSGLAVDGSGSVFVADAGNSTIRKVTAGGTVSTVAGSPGVTGNTDGLGSVARFFNPAGIGVDAAGRLFVADTRNQTIREGVPPGGKPIGTGGSGGSGGPAGSGGSGGVPGSSGGGSGGALGATVVGSILVGANNSTSTTGRSVLLHPIGIAQDLVGNVFVCDTANNCIRQIATDGTATVIAGKPGTAGSADGKALDATFNSPTGLVVDNVNNFYVCDTGNASIRKIAANGTVTTLAGTAGSRGTTDGVGANARFGSPQGITIDAVSNLYVTDTVNNTIRKIATDGTVTTYAGTAGTVGDRDGTLSEALFNNPVGITIDSTSYLLFVADTYNNTVRRININNITAPDIDPATGVQRVDSSGKGLTVVVVPAGTVATVAGSAGISGNFDGTGTYSLFNLPMAVGVDLFHNLYVVDTGNNAIRRLTVGGIVETLAGIPGISGSRDGPAKVALFNQPQGIVLTSSSVVVLDTGNSTMRTMDGLFTNVTTVPVHVASTPSGGSAPIPKRGGGGAVDDWFAGALLVLAAVGYLRSRRRDRAA